MDYEIWIKTFKQASSTPKVQLDLLKELRDHLDLKKIFICGDVSQFLKHLAQYYDKADETVLPDYITSIETIIRYAGHDIEFYATDIILKIVSSVFVGKMKIRDSAKAAIKRIFVKVRNIDLFWEGLVNLGLKNSLISIKTRAMRTIPEFLRLDLSVLSNTKNTAFSKVRQSLEIVISCMQNGISIQTKDSSRQCLTDLLNEFDLSEIRRNLSKADEDFLDEIEGKFVKKKY